MEFTNYLPIFYIAILIVISGMFSGSETSVTSVNRSKIHKLAIKGDRKAKKLLKLIDNKNDLINVLSEIFDRKTKTTILIKGSRSSGMDEVVKTLSNKEIS